MKRRRMDRFWRWLSFKLPKKLVYYATIRLWAFSTTGTWGDTEVTGLSISEALKRWNENS